MDPDDLACYAAAEVQPEYERAQLTFDVDHPNFGRKEPIRELVRHELLHVLVAPLAAHCGEERADAEELVVTALERAPFWRLVERSGK